MFWRVGIYSVDSASEFLDIPRPTLYRYLREYSIPHFKKSGRISIPEESVEEIRRVRDLHREGMGTASVRKLLRDSTDAVPVRKDGELSDRLDHLARELESLREDPRALEEASSPHALRTILARQSLLISAVFNLTGMVEDLIRANGHPRRHPQETYDALERISLAGGVAGSDPNGYGRFPEERPETHLTRSRSVVRVPAESRPVKEKGDSPHGEFGTLSRKRRRNAAILGGAVLFAGLVVTLLAVSGILFG